MNDKRQNCYLELICLRSTTIASKSSGMKQESTPSTKM